MTITSVDLGDLSSWVGRHLGASDWHEVGIGQIRAFADATGDHQWIHVDEESAAAGPFGAPIAHGYLTLSLVPYLLPTFFDVTGTSMGLNYGCEKVRFPAPLRAGTRVRCEADLLSVDDVAAGRQVTLATTIVSAENVKPHCVAQVIYRYLF
jgi:acyl dehydratase